MDKEGNVCVRRTTSNDQNENLEQSHIFSTAKIETYFRPLTLPLAQRRRGVVNRFASLLVPCDLPVAILVLIDDP